MTRPRLVRVLTALVLCTVIGFLAYRILANLEQIRAFSWHMRPTTLALSVGLEVGVFAAGTFVWRTIVARFDAEPVAFRTLLRIWSGSTLGRYVPGVIWQFAIGFGLANRHRVSPTLLLTSLSVHMGVTLAAASLIAAALAPAFGPTSLLWPGCVLLVALAAIHPRCIDGARRLLARIIRRELPAWHGSYRDGLVLLALNLASWLVYGTAFWLLLGSLAEMPFATLRDAIGIHALVFVAGYVAFVVPAGLGVREAALALLLGPYFPAGVAAAVAAFTRLWTIAAELATCVVSLVLAPRDEREAN
jgi:uncharacterized membrane protein YbhN (UPF0104 family)